MATPHLAEEVSFFDKERTKEELDNLTEEERALLEERELDEEIDEQDE